MRGLGLCIHHSRLNFEANLFDRCVKTPHFSILYGFSACDYGDDQKNLVENQLTLIFNFLFLNYLFITDMSSQFTKIIKGDQDSQVFTAQIKLCIIHISMHFLLN